MASPDLWILWIWNNLEAWQGNWGFPLTTALGQTANRMGHRRGCEAIRGDAGGIEPRECSQMVAGTERAGTSSAVRNRQEARRLFGFRFRASAPTALRRTPH